MLLFAAIAVGAALITLVNPMAGIVLALKADVATSIVLAPILGASYGEGENQHHTLLITLPVLAVLLVRMILQILSRRKSMAIPAFNSVDLGLFGLIVVVTFGSFRSESFIFGSEIVGRLLVLGVSYYIFSRTAVVCKNDVKRSVLSFMILVWLLSVGSGLYVLFSTGEIGSNVISAAGEIVGKVSLTKVNPISFSMLMGEAILVALFWLLSNRDSSRLLTFSILCSLPLLFGLMLTTAERGPFLSLVMAAAFLTVALILIGNDARYLVYSAIFFSAVLAGGVALYLSQPALSEGLAGRISDLGSGESTVGIRIRLYSQALDLFGESPLLGNGTGALENINGRGLYAHNLILEILAEQGLLGFAMLSIFLAGLVNRIKTSILLYHDPICAYFAALVLFHLAESMVSGTLWGLKSLYFAAGMLVVLEYLAREDFANYWESPCHACQYGCVEGCE
ncbi:O-antigen ligase family protein [Desulfomonile tiedjei]|uniref:O-Antigen ligase n=1 Tax=Desulfomonile tiedjei (strain ATCC 49306 / DSM 6799 / DCB-1) TaxID=706587 RepID=I4CBJ7_DESTA|nr:O-antigen ligase family protein [Desulfomonile tiedjei]AFM26938.1 O-Antigen ligase [Desulfomonile tiedjei DSM 6799]